METTIKQGDFEKGKNNNQPTCMNDPRVSCHWVPRGKVPEGSIPRGDVPGGNVLGGKVAEVRIPEERFLVSV